MKQQKPNLFAIVDDRVLHSIPTKPIMGNFVDNRRALESEGVLIGGWSFKNVLIPKKTQTRGTLSVSQNLL